MGHDDLERELGEQPIAKIIAMHGFKPNDIVSASTQQLTHKMIAKAVKGRRLTPHIQIKILSALNKAANKSYSLKDLFNY